MTNMSDSSTLSERQHLRLGEGREKQAEELNYKAKGQELGRAGVGGCPGGLRKNLSRVHI